MKVHINVAAIAAVLITTTAAALLLSQHASSLPNSSTHGLTNSNVDKSFAHASAVKINSSRAHTVAWLKGRTIVLDPGHGGTSSGAVVGGTQEQDLTLSITLKLARILRSQGARVILTRDRKRTVSLKERTDLANSVRPNVLVSVHINAMPNDAHADGIETYYWTQQGRKLAQRIYLALGDKLGAPLRYMHKRDLWMCKQSQVPSTLVEVGYLTNATKRKKLITPHYQELSAEAIALGIDQYFQHSGP